MSRYISAVLFASLLMSTACAPREVRLCDRECECEGCSAFEFDNCVDDFDDDEREAAHKDCLREYDEYVACQSATWICDGDDFKTDCKFEKEDYKACVD